MIRKRLLTGCLCSILAISLLCTGCSKKDDKKAAPSDTTINTTNDENKPEPAPEAESVIKNDWEIARVSGTAEDFEAYFKLDVKSYKNYNEAAGTLTEISYYSSVILADRQAFVYTPYGYDENATYPVIYLIHGLGCDGTQWTSMSCCRIFDNMIAGGEIQPFVAVFPSVIPADGLTENSFSAENINAFATFPQEWALDLAPYISEHYAVSTSREDTAICGLSMGGMEALDTGFRLLDRFNYIGSFSAAPTLDESLLTTAGSDHTPALVLLCSGDKDSTVQDNPKNYHNSLTANGVDHIWYQHPGQGHSGAVWDLGLLNFLKRIFQ